MTIKKKKNVKNAQTIAREIESDKILRYQGIERYANELQHQLNEANFKIHQLEIKLRRNQTDRDQAISDLDQSYLVQTMHDELLLKNKELEELRAELVNISTSMYSGVAKSKMQTAYLDQLQQLDTHRKVIFEYERREKLRANEWHAITCENAQLRKTVSDLQSVIQSQMTDVNVMLMKKEQKLGLWASKISEISNGGNEMRRRAAEFLVSQLQEYEQNQNQYINKMEELKRQISFIEIANTELKVEISQLKDILRSSDPNSLLSANQALKDRVQQLSIESSMHRVLSLQRLNDNLQKRINDMTEVESVLRNQIETLEKQSMHFDEDACINYLERLLQEKERIISTYVSSLKKPTSSVSDEQHTRDRAMVNRTKKLEDLVEKVQRELGPSVAESHESSLDEESHHKGDDVASQLSDIHSVHEDTQENSTFHSMESVKTSSSFEAEREEETTS